MTLETKQFENDLSCNVIFFNFVVSFLLSSKSNQFLPGPVPTCVQSLVKTDLEVDRSFFDL